MPNLVARYTNAKVLMDVFVGMSESEKLNRATDSEVAEQDGGPLKVNEPSDVYTVLMFTRVIIMKQYLRAEVAYNHILSLVLPISYRVIDHGSYVRGGR